MKLYKITRTTRIKWDTYDSAIVAARNETEASKIQPNLSNEQKKKGVHFGILDNTWVPENEVEVDLIGTAKRGTKFGVILASFNAG